MKILIFTPYIGSNYGGLSKAVKETAEALGSLGLNVDLITTNANNLDKIQEPLNKWIYEKNYRIRYFSCWHRQDFIVSLPLINWLIQNIADYDIVHTNTVFAPIVSFVHWLCQLRQIPYIMTPHGMLEPWALSYKGWKKRLYYNIFEKLALQKASAIQVIANVEAHNVKSLGFEHIVTVPNGIHRQEFENLPEPEVFYQHFPETCNKNLILFLGRIDPKKGLDLLAPAFATVRAKFPQTHLVVAGPDNIGFLSTAQHYFLQAGCLDAVTFTGMLTGELKHAALAAANLYVAPSYSEGFSMSVLEGMASGLPCVITTGCNFPEAATAKAAYVVDININAIADGLIQYLSNPQQAKAMGERARGFIFQNYTWNSAAEKLIPVYKSIFDRKPLPKYLSYSQMN
ncbi:MAG: glycosyltransferase [Fischerella sp.]|jgi:glycosyltransferase involved in cell wall biosynthesis|uniref:glycosyltransferase n=1 Tax=Fischerella sp. TaxID=1191 RepID=UPI0017B0FE9D|nr:glycosyltransferase [Fischerella sp.]NWF61046.1 glycosyltransferase [Fischerella sp.]